MAKAREFDKFVRDYTGGNEDPLKRLFGENLDQFIYIKARWLWNYLTEISDQINFNENYYLLDYGCGTGEMLRWMKLFGFPGQLHGADVSRAMLAEAEKRCDTASRPLFSCIGETKTDFADNSFHCIVATCVFHHIEPDKRDIVLAEMKRILIPRGIIVIFEHNPLNPLTRLIVKRAAIDKNAVLLYPREIEDRLFKSSLVNITREYIMFFPPNLKIFNRLEKYLRWLSLGAQYVVVGRKHD